MFLTSDWPQNTLAAILVDILDLFYNTDLVVTNRQLDITGT